MKSKNLPKLLLLLFITTLLFFITNYYYSKSHYTYEDGIKRKNAIHKQQAKEYEKYYGKPYPEINYNDSIAKICSEYPKTDQQSLVPGVILVYFKPIYSNEDMRNFIAQNGYILADEELLEGVSGKGVTLTVPLGEEECWAHELSKNINIKRASVNEKHDLN